MYRYSYLDGHQGHPHYFTDSQIKKFKKSVNSAGEDKEFLILIKNLSDPTKFKIFMLLNKIDDISVSGISNTLNENQSTISHALRDLKNIGLVTSYRCGKLLCYKLADEDKKSAKYLDKFFKMFGGYKNWR